MVDGMCIMVSMSDSGKSLVCDVVLGFLCPPVLLGKLSIEAAAINAKQREERSEPARDVSVGPQAFVVVAICVATLIAEFTGAI